MLALRGPGETAGFGHGAEIAELMNLHDPPPPVSVVVLVFLPSVAGAARAAHPAGRSEREDLRENDLPASTLEGKCRLLLGLSLVGMAHRLGRILKCC
jgi:hypothetical protein